MRSGTGTTLERFDTPPDASRKTALVFTGGGSRGAVEVGALKAIATRIRPDAVIGTSVGAINGAFYAAGLTPTELERLWLGLTSRFVFPINWEFIWRPWKARSISHQENLKRFLRDNLPVETFEECKIPLYINATELRTGRSVFFLSGNIIDAVLASAAIPPYYPPRVVGGIEYVDGGVSNVIALDEAKALKCKQVIAVSTYDEQESGQLHNVFRLSSHVLHMVIRCKLHDELDLETKGFERKHITLIKPGVPANMHITDFRHTRRLIAIGEEEARRMLHHIKV
jgi:NTE family protein